MNRHSPITSEWVTMGQKRYGTIVIDGDVIYCDELRSSEGGRSVIVQYKGDEKKDITPLSMSVRSRVHEYGGAPYTVFEEKVYFVNDKDQRIYLDSEPLTEPGIRFADLHVTPPYLIAVGEKGNDNFIVALHLPTKKWTKIASGNDFYASPAIHPSGSKIAFLTWNHPFMPWDAAEIWVGDFSKGNLSNLEKIAGGEQESIFQPQWSPEGILHFVSDKTGWWNLYRYNGTIEAIDSKEEEFGLPQWNFGMSTYAFSGPSILTASFGKGKWKLAKDGKDLNLPWTYFTQVRACPKFAVFIAGSPTEEKMLIKLTDKPTILSHNIRPKISPDDLSEPEFITFRSGDRKAHAFYYAPKNFEGLPPLIVMTHGGPTSATTPTLDFKVQFWTSRGFAILDVDYTGSTGYGRSYRDALKGQWGLYDIADCEAGVQYLIDQKKVDPRRVAIRGGSAGGFTTLAALTFGSKFSVGASYYGISNLTTLAHETHKFELKYLDSLIGAKNLYIQRSPLFNLDRFHAPVIFFQGAEDKVVPLSQAQVLFDALRKKGIPTELVVYEGEQHGFRKSENIRDSLERELAFYLKVWSKLK